VIGVSDGKRVVAAVAGITGDVPHLAWTVPVPDDTMVDAFGRDGDRIVLAFVTRADLSVRPRTELIAVGAADGVEAWRTKLPEGFSANKLAGDVVFGPFWAVPENATGTLAVGFDLASGDVRWTFHDDNNVSIACGDLVVLAGAHGLQVLDPRGGGELSTISLDAPAQKVAIADGVAYVIAGEQGQDLRAIELVSGRELWRHQGPVGPSAQVLVDRDTIYMSTNGDAERALDRATGRRLWEWGIGEAHRAWLVPEGGKSDERLLVTHTFGDDLTVFAHGASRVPIADVEIDGRITQISCGETAHAEVLIGDDLKVKTDADGAFHARVRGRGLLEVSTQGIEPQIVTLGERPFVTVELSGDLCPDGE
jgi:outer membrane protein assembly factor BamB